MRLPFLSCPYLLLLRIRSRELADTILNLDFQVVLLLLLCLMSSPGFLRFLLCPSSTISADRLRPGLSGPHADGRRVPLVCKDWYSTHQAVSGKSRCPLQISGNHRDSFFLLRCGHGRATRASTAAGSWMSPIFFFVLFNLFSRSSPFSLFFDQEQRGDGYTSPFAEAISYQRRSLILNRHLSLPR